MKTEHLGRAAVVPFCVRGASKLNFANTCATTVLYRDLFDDAFSKSGYISSNLMMIKE
jgi:hypothetical protein